MALGLTLQTHTARHPALERRPRTVCVACTVVCDKTRSPGTGIRTKRCDLREARFDRLASTRTRNR